MMHTISNDQRGNRILKRFNNILNLALISSLEEVFVFSALPGEIPNLFFVQEIGPITATNYYVHTVGIVISLARLHRAPRPAGSRGWSLEILDALY